ncbi:tetratricopeptide repeat protein [Desulfobacterales bacterium HSG16]|nr:tetratricopeptide repeat protein [Desulfobacterales bacterium HSG16]
MQTQIVIQSMSIQRIAVLCVFICTLLALLIPSIGYSSEDARNFLDGIREYRSGNYESAIKAFSKIAESGVQNGKLYYNLANAHLKNDDIGQAMLWYERALKLIPHDPDLKFNHKHALSLVKDERDEKNFPILKVVFFWKHMLSKKTVKWIAIVLNLSFWVILAFRTIRKKRRIFRSSLYFVLIPLLIFTSTAFYNYYENAFLKEAIILYKKVSVRSALSDGSTELFVLHSGTKVKIEKEKGDYFRIFFSEGKIGWLKKSDLGVI